MTDSRILNMRERRRSCGRQDEHARRPHRRAETAELVDAIRGPLYATDAAGRAYEMLAFGNAFHPA